MQNQPGLDYRFLFENIPTACMAINRKFEIVAASNYFLAITLTQRKNIIGRNVADVFPDNPNDHFSKNSEQSRLAMQRVFDTGEPQSSRINKYDIHGADGSFVERFWKDMNFPVRNRNNEIEWVLHCTEDVTDSIHAKQGDFDWVGKLSETSIRAEELRLLSGHLHNAREEERARIAREIHDGLGQQLGVIKMDVNWISRRIGNDDETVKEKIKEINTMLTDTVRLVRQISTELRPSLLDDMGLIAAIEWQLGELTKRSGIDIHFDNIPEEPEVSDALKLNLFRILQECVNNVLRHASAKNIWVDVTAQDSNLTLSVRDDGIGFDTAKKNGKTNFGLLSMKERTIMMGGKYLVESSPAKGTSVTVSTPMR